MCELRDLSLTRERKPEAGSVLIIAVGLIGALNLEDKRMIPSHRVDAFSLLIKVASVNEEMSSRISNINWQYLRITSAANLDPMVLEGTDVDCS